MGDAPPLLGERGELERRLAGRPLALFLDFDGTLAPIVNDPDAAAMSPGMRAALSTLARRVPVAVVSGRDRADVARRVGIAEIHYVGSHGFDIAGPAGAFEHPAAVAALPELARAEAELRARLAPIPGALVERKRFTLAAHFRQAPAARDRVGAHVAAVAAGSGLRCTAGKQVLELRPAIDWDKGEAVKWLLERLAPGAPGLFPVYVGDDETDEDAFRALRERGDGVGVLVGDPGAAPEEKGRATLADYRLASPDEVERFLRRL